jgi:hypothetical protein
LTPVSGQPAKPVCGKIDKEKNSGSAPEIFGERAVGQGFSKMQFAGLVGAIEVGEGAGDAQHAMIAAR